VSRPDRAPRVAVDFARPTAKPGAYRPVLALVIVIAMLAGLVVAVTQLLLR
jgi:hypothetical protein